MSAPSFIPPTDIKQEPGDQAPSAEQGSILSPPLMAMVASIEAARAGMNAQFDALLAQVNSLAYMGAAINSARRARNPAAPSSEMPATFGASPRSATDAPPTRSAEELSDAIES